MRMLKDGLISIVAAVRHRPQVMAIPDFGPCRWRFGRSGMEGQVGPLRTRGCGPAARTPRNLDPREAGWGPTCDRLFSLARSRRWARLGAPIARALLCKAPSKYRSGRDAPVDPCGRGSRDGRTRGQLQSAAPRLTGGSSSASAGFRCRSRSWGWQGDRVCRKGVREAGGPGRSASRRAGCQS
jgi:hypothetical protein